MLSYFVCSNNITENELTENKDNTLILLDVKNQYDNNKRNIIMFFFLGLFFTLIVIISIFLIYDYFKNQNKTLENLYNSIANKFAQDNLRKKDDKIKINNITEENLAIIKIIDTIFDEYLKIQNPTSIQILIKYAQSKVNIFNIISEKNTNILKIIHELLKHLPEENLQNIYNKIADKGT